MGKMQCTACRQQRSKKHPFSKKHPSIPPLTPKFLGNLDKPLSAPRLSPASPFMQRRGDNPFQVDICSYPNILYIRCIAYTVLHGQASLSIP